MCSNSRSPTQLKMPLWRDFGKNPEAACLCLWLLADLPPCPTADDHCFFCKEKTLQIHPKTQKKKKRKKFFSDSAVLQNSTDRKTSSLPELNRPVYARTPLMFLGTAEAHCAAKTQHAASETDQRGEGWTDICYIEE